MSNKKKENLVALSASRINTLNKCSWQYYCNYVLRLPDEGNDGARRGTITHNVLEFLLKKENVAAYERIADTRDPFSVDEVRDMIMREAKELGVDDEENLGMIKSFIMTGLDSDFFCQDDIGLGSPELLPPEKKFELVNEEPLYKILGFIDKICLYPESKTVRIVDYKTSKSKFSGEEATFNIQAMMYSLAALKLFPEMETAFCDFLFLKFKSKPLLRIEFERGELDGFEHYLEHVSDGLYDFGLKTAGSNFAADTKKNFWLCGKFKGMTNKEGKPAYICSYKYPFKYFAVTDKKNGKILKTAYIDKEKEIREYEKGLKPGTYTIEIKNYGGCPKFRKKLKGQTK